MAINRDEGDEKRIATSLVRLSTVSASMGDFRQAIANGEEALTLLKDPQAPFRYGNALYNLASYYNHVDDYATKLRYFEEALGIFRASNSAIGLGYTLSGMAYVYVQLGDEKKASLLRLVGVGVKRVVTSKPATTKATAPSKK